MVAHRSETDNQFLGNLTVGLSGGYKAQHFYLSMGQTGGIRRRWRRLGLVPVQSFGYPLHQWQHTQLSRNRQGFVQQVNGFGPVSRTIPLLKDVGGVAIGPSQLGTVASPAAKSQGVLKMDYFLVQVAHGLRKEAKKPVNR